MSRDAQSAYLEQLIEREHDSAPESSSGFSGEARGGPMRPPVTLPRDPRPDVRTAYRPVLFFALLALIPVASVALWVYAPSEESAEGSVLDQEATLLREPLAPSAVKAATPPAPAELLVASEPDGSLVYIDGVVGGLTPYRTDSLAPGWRTVSVERAGYVTRDTLLRIAPAASIALSLALDARDAEPAPEPATAGEESAAPPLADAPPTPSPSERVAQRDVAASPSAATPQRSAEAPAPVSETGTLSVLVRPWGSIYVDDTLRATDTDLRWSDTVPVGSRVVRVVHPVLGVQQHNVVVDANQTTALVIDLY